MRNVRRYIFGNLMLSSGLALAQVGFESNLQRCSTAQIAQLGAQIGVSRFTQSANGVIVSAACKVWPRDKSKTIMVVGHSTKVELEKAVVIAISETGSGRLMSVHHGKIEEDAGTELHASSLKIDTARYDLALDVRAFAVDIESNGRGASCPDGGTGAVRSLYVQDGTTIRRVLDGLSLEDWQFLSGGSANCNSRNEETVIERFPTSIAIAKNSTNGYSDLAVTIESKLDNGKMSKRQPLLHLLKFDGRQYPTDKLNSAYWKWRQ